MVSQLTSHSLITAAELAITRIGLTLCFDILKFANFTPTDLAVMGAYLRFLFNVQCVKDHVISLPLGSPYLTPFEEEVFVGLGLSFFRYDFPSMIK